MLFYFLIWFCLFVFSLLEINNLQKEHSFFLFAISTFFLFFLSFVRWETGTDWDGYYEYFNHIFYYFQDSDFEFGFARINEIIKLTFGNYTILLFVFSCIIFFFQTKVILKYSPLPLFSLFFLWSISFANVFYIRQTVAIALLFYSTTFLVNKKTWLFFICIYIATLFHSTSFVFVFAYFLFRLRITIKQMFFFLLMSFLFSIFLVSIFNSILPLVGGIIQHKLETYLALGEDGGTMTQSSLGEVLIRGLANKLFIFVLLIYFSSKEMKENLIFRGYLNLYWFGAILYFSMASISIVFVRFSFPYDIVQVILLPLLLKNVSSNNRYVLYAIISVFLLFRFYITLFGSYYDLYVPYKTIFQL